MNSKTIEPLSAFKWDTKEDWTPDDFFNEGVTKPDDEKEKPVEKPDETGEEEEDLTEESNNPPVEDSHPDPKEEEDEDSEEPSEEFEKVSPIVALAKDLKEMGYLDDVTDDMDASTLLDKVESSLEERIDSGIEQVIENWKGEIGEVGIKFIQFTMNGGDPMEFFTKFSEQSVDLSSEYGQEKFLKNYLIDNQGYDPEDAEDLIERYKEVDKLGEYANRFYNKIKAKKTAEQEALLQQKEQERVQREQAYLAFKENLKDVAKATDHVLIRGKNGQELGKINFTQSERRSLVNYITQNNVDAGGKYISEFTRDFNKVYKEQPEKLLLIAKLMKNDFDLSDFVQNQVSEKLKEVKTNLQRVETQKKTKLTKPRSNKPAWDYF